MLKVAVLGAGGSLGARVCRRLRARDDVKLSTVTRFQGAEASEIPWDFRSALPAALRSAHVVINCARSPDFSHNIRFNRLLYEGLPASVRFLNISSNCVFARPRGRLEQLLFRGDGYIREKRTIEAMAQRHPQATLLRPSVVADEGGWQAFLRNVDAAEEVLLPRDAATCRIRVMSAEEVAEVIESLLRPSPEACPEEELASHRPLLSGFLRKVPRYEGTTRTYYDNWIKNAVVVAFNSRFMPDWLVLTLQGALLRRRRATAAAAPSAPSSLKVEGMTRLYLCGAHTR